MDLHEMNIPFAELGDKDEIKKALKRRLKIVRKFMGKDDVDLLSRALDIGESNKFGRTLGIKNNTIGDLNDCVVSERGLVKYDVVVCFEVIEHTMNPLTLMKGIKSLMNPGGRCYISTPVPNVVSIYHSRAHFAEYKRNKLEQLFRYIGFEIVKYRRFLLWDINFMFYGIRPLLRVLFTRNQIWKLRKPS